VNALSKELRVGRPALRTVSLSLFLLCLNFPAAKSENSPERAADEPVVHLNGKTGGTLENDRIVATWQVRDGRLSGLRITDKGTSAGPDSHAVLQLNEPFSI
jgi:hypothetical protein